MLLTCRKKNYLFGLFLFLSVFLFQTNKYCYLEFVFFPAAKLRFSRIKITHKLSSLLFKKSLKLIVSNK